MIGTHLIAMAGLPGAGKSSIAEALSRALRATLLSVDPIEAAMWRSGLAQDQTGLAAYAVAEALAIENLRQGQTVIVDAVNPVEEARDMWRVAAKSLTIPISFIEVICGDRAVHQARIESRVRNIKGMPEVTWARVEDRMQEYEAWAGPRLVLDTAAAPNGELLEKSLSFIQLCAEAHLKGPSELT